MDFNMAYWVGFGFTFFLAMVVVFVYESAERVGILNEEFFIKVIISLIVAMCWFMATLVGLAYVVAKLIIFCREKWRNK